MLCRKCLHMIQHHQSKDFDDPLKFKVSCLEHKEDIFVHKVAHLF